MNKGKICPDLSAWVCEEAGEVPVVFWHYLMRALSFHNSRNLAHRKPGVKHRAANRLLLITRITTMGVWKDVKIINPKHARRSRYFTYLCGSQREK